MSAGSEAEELRVVLITAPDATEASRLAHLLVGERLAACVNVVPGVRSVYRWEGEVQEDAEVLLIAKTPEARLDALVARIDAAHPYDVPEVLALPVAGGSPTYRAWVAQASRS
jgi:periplasmic divalent cation tolerance protein